MEQLDDNATTGAPPLVFYDLADLARVSRLSVSAIRAALARGELAAVQHGAPGSARRRVLVPVAEAHRWLGSFEPYKPERRQRKRRGLRSAS